MWARATREYLRTTRVRRYLLLEQSKRQYRTHARTPTPAPLAQSSDGGPAAAVAATMTAAASTMSGGASTQHPRANVFLPQRVWTAVRTAHTAAALSDPVPDDALPLGKRIVQLARQLRLADALVAYREHRAAGCVGRRAPRGEGAEPTRGERDSSGQRSHGR